MIDFKPWPKTPRLYRDVIITEKIDGTNAAVIVAPLEPHEYDGRWTGDTLPADVVESDDGRSLIRVGAQSRNRLIHPGADNAGFAAWVEKNAVSLARILGPGHHYGEWWGSGIQRGYGLPKGERRFSLFNVERHESLKGGVPAVPGLDVVPELWRGWFDTEAVDRELDALAAYGSVAAPGFMRPEGVVVFHTAANLVFKALIENDGQPKGAALAAVA